MTKSALVVDDSKSARFALRKFLEGFGYKVDTAESAADAYRQLAGRLPDVVFLDHIMPGVDGFEALKVIKSDPLSAKVPVVICSSNEGEDFVHQARLRGASDVLQKPPSPEQIAGVLANLGSSEIDLQLSGRAAPPAPAAPKPAEPSAMERLMATLPPKPAPAVVTPPAAATMPVAPKVQPIREPAVAIQQAVMKSLRDAMPPPVEARPMSPPELPAVPAFLSEADRPEPVAAAPAYDAVEQDQRIAALRQEFGAEMAALRAQIAQLHLPEERLRALAQDAAKQRTQQLAQSLEQHLTALQGNIDAMLRAQNERLEQALQLARQTAAEEAERVVMSAAQRIADQMTSAMLKTMGQQLASLGRNAF